MNEFKIIDKYLKPLTLNNPGALKLKDDIYYDYKKNMAISLDTYVEGVHFLDATDPNKFLKRVLRASLSDLYAKGINPKNYFLSFAIKKNLPKSSWLKKIRKILKAEQRKFKILISGGDITHSSKLVITCVVIGYCRSKPVFRSGCMINDDIYVTGNLGDSYLGLNILKKKMNFGKFNSFFKKKYYEPDLQIRFAPYLNNIASSSIDISDGLAQDLKNLCFNTKFGVSINLNKLPLSTKTQLLINKKRINLKNIFSNGDDYQILFTSCSKNRSKIISLSKKTNTKITRIGIIKKNKNIRFIHNGKLFTLSGKKMGYMHNFV